VTQTENNAKIIGPWLKNHHEMYNY